MFNEYLFPKIKKTKALFGLFLKYQNKKYGFCFLNWKLEVLQFYRKMEK